MKKVFSVLLLMTLLMTSLLACGQNGQKDTGTTTKADAANTSSSLTTTSEAVTTTEPAKALDFDGSEVTLLVWSDVENPEFEVESATGDLINDAIYERNRSVEDRLNVKLKFLETPGNFGNQQNFMSQAQNMILSGTSLDIMAAYSLTAAGLVANNLTYKLNDLEYLDFSKPWWPDRLVNEATIKGNIYFCAGDLSTNMLHKMHAIFFDKGMCRDNGIQPDDLYSSVFNGTWTMDQLFEITANVYQDLNADGVKDRNDKFGLYICDNYFDVFFYASDLRTVDRKDDGSPVISESFGSEKAINLADKVGKFFADSMGAFFITDFTEARKMMQRESMMIISRCDVAYKFLRTTEGLDYGVLPIPKYDETQAEYVSCLAFPCTLYTVSYSAQDPQMVGAVLEALGSEGYRSITPALFETTMKLKYANDDVTSQVYDIIRTSVSFDLGRMCASSLNNLTYTLFRTACSKNSGSFATTFKANKVVMQKLLESMVAAIR